MNHAQVDEWGRTSGQWTSEKVPVGQAGDVRVDAGTYKWMSGDVRADMIHDIDMKLNGLINVIVIVMAKMDE